VNVLLNDNKDITHVVAGEPVQAHDKGCEIEKSLAGNKVDRKADITITSNSGAPLDLDLYQTVKGIDNASQITREGGIIIIASACNKGVGSAAFREMHISSKSPREVLQRIASAELAATGKPGLPVLSRSLSTWFRSDDYPVESMGMTPVEPIEEVWPGSGAGAKC
jgi:nickel-dependent lactate racemase